MSAKRAIKPSPKPQPAKKTSPQRPPSATPATPAPPAAKAAAKRPSSTSRVRKRGPQVTEASRPLRVLMIASEAAPFSKTGGLADVSTSLSRALGRLGHEVTLVTPRYRGITAGEPIDSVRAFVAGHWLDAGLHAAPLGPGARVVFIDCPPLYDRAGLYLEHERDYPDNAARFAFLSIAALEWAATWPQPPDVIHAHDWQAGLTGVYARRLGHTPVVFTIHNIAYQGIFDKGWLSLLGLSWSDFTIAGFEFWDRLSFLKSGLNISDALTTVSPTYAEEIQRPEYGHGLEGVVAARRDVLTGILNGIDADEWNPLTDRYLPTPFDADDLSGKRVAKKALLDAFGLPSDDEAMTRPVIGMVSRMVEQKGLDLIAAAAPHLIALDAAFAIVGTGDARYERMWRDLAAAAPSKVGVRIGFDEQHAHLVEGGADLFLMPSRFEPCGLNQMYSMRYGTIPVVRAVGGLVDTVRPYDPATGQGTGFLFSDYHPMALIDAVRRALDAFGRARVWERLQVNGMKEDFSWDRSAGEYLTVYKRVMATART